MIYNYALSKWWPFELSSVILVSKCKVFFTWLFYYLYQDGNYKVAIKYYEKCQRNLEFETTLQGEDEEKRKEIVAVAHLNMAMCYLKTEEFVKVREHCDKALELDDKCVKAYFRRGQVTTRWNSANVTLFTRKLEPHTKKNQIQYRLIWNFN